MSSLVFPHPHQNGQREDEQRGQQHDGRDGAAAAAARGLELQHLVVHLLQALGQGLALLLQMRVLLQHLGRGGLLEELVVLRLQVSMLLAHLVQLAVAQVDLAVEFRVGLVQHVVQLVPQVGLARVLLEKELLFLLQRAAGLLELVVVLLLQFVVLLL